MISRLDKFIDVAQRLSDRQKLDLIAALAGPDAPAPGIERTHRDIWRPRTLEDHIVEQGIPGPQDLAQFHAADVWPEEDDLEDFLRDLEAQRQPPPQKGRH